MPETVSNFEPELKNLSFKIESYLQNHFGKDTKITAFESLSGGACQDNYSIDLQLSNGSLKKMVMRTDKGESLFSSLPKPIEFKICKIAFENGVKTPEPILLEINLTLLNKPFYFMERISGRGDGRFIVKDNSIAAYRNSEMVKDLARNLAKIHSVTPDKVSEKEIFHSLPVIEKESYVAKTLEDFKKTMDATEEPHPAIYLVWNWLKANQPPVDSIVLTHGDFRTGNFLINPDGLQGILDWEFAHFGDRHEDIAWLCMRDWRFGKVNKEVGGFADRKEFYDLYSQFAGFVVDPVRVNYWEIMGNLRWAVGSIGQAWRHISGKDKGIELAAIGRRTSELEFECLKLIENAR